MPKILSLKKGAKVAPPKNQKSIVQFFKNTNGSTSQSQSKPPENNHKTPIKCIETQTIKRKAISPVDVKSLETGEKHIVDKTVKTTEHTPKKLKTNIGKSPTKVDIIKKFAKNSPTKENGLSVKSDKDLFNYQSKEIEGDNCTDDCGSKSQSEKSRSPLTPLKCDNVTKSSNHDDNDQVNETHFESVIKHNGNHVTPKKLTFDDNIECPNKGNCSKRSPDKKSPKKSTKEEVPTLPKIAQLRTPEKLSPAELSPSKRGSTVKTLDLDDVGDMFGDEWEMDGLEEDITEDLDLSTMQRCEVINVTQHQTRLELRLKNAENKRGTCFVDGIWLDTPISPGEVLSVLATRDSSGQFSVGNSSGLLVLRPDHLMSSTSVVAGVFCKRKALLQERWKGIDSANTAMTIGILIHELVQKALTQNIINIDRLRLETNKIIKESMQMLYDAGLSEEETRSNMETYIAPLAEFMKNYVAGRPNGAMQGQKDKWNGHIDKVLDIEENMCCPQLGLKGKIDATLQVTIHDRKGNQREIVPLELKSGKASVSAEHRGQLVMYGMMLSLQQGDDPTKALQRGLLLYLRDRVDLREVSCGYPERRDLVMLRNQLVQYLSAGPNNVDTEQLVDIEEAALVLKQDLPEPVHHENACTKCPYLTLCSLHLWHTDGPKVTEKHPLSKLRDQALGHLSPEHIKYFLHWTALLRMEERGQMTASPLHSLWTDSVEKRVKRGTCLANLKLKSTEVSGDRHLHTFEKQTTSSESKENRNKGPQEGEFSIVGIENRPWIAAGVVTLVNEKQVQILLERDLSRRLNKDVSYHIDTYESYATTVQNLTNLGVLMEDSDRALRLRKLIIDKECPEFAKKLPREVGRLGSKLMRSLNIEQQRAVLKALAANDYALLQGLPGTGKTQTISVLIQMLVGLKQRVLVTAHTHSAVDTVLSRLPESIRVMRLGSSARVASCLSQRTEQKLTSQCETPQELEKLYESMEVVGVTCLGAAHAMLARITFDVCIVDEATQVLQSTVLRPLFAAKRFVLVGDPEQLPPVVRSRAARRLGMEESLFHRLMKEEATCTLQLQYRMNQALADIANRVAYDNRLKCANQNVAQANLSLDLKKTSQLIKESPWLEAACSPSAEHAAIFLNTETITATENSKNCTNADEACIVIALVEVLKQGGVQSSDIGVIAPYRDQVSLLRRSLVTHSVEVSTVDQFQGRDKSVIIYSCTKRDGGHEDRKVREGEVLNDQRRMAVSVTRAKHKLIVIGNSRALQKYTPVQRLIDACAPILLDREVIASIVSKYKRFIS